LRYANDVQGGAIYSLGAQGNMPFEMPWKFQNISTILPPSVQSHNWIHDSGDSETAALDHGGIGKPCWVVMQPAKTAVSQCAYAAGYSYKLIMCLLL
jgi:hypothetical protein